MSLQLLGFSSDSGRFQFVSATYLATPPIVNATPWGGLSSSDLPLALVHSLERTTPGFRVFEFSESPGRSR